MLFDKELLFSDAQAITADAASTNVVKMDGRLKEIAFGTPIPVRIQCVEDFTGTGITSVAVKIQTSVDEAFTSPIVLAETTIAAASLKAGYVAPINFIPAGNKGFMRVYYDVTLESGGSITKGKFTAGVVAANDNSYQDM